MLRVARTGCISFSSRSMQISPQPFRIAVLASRGQTGTRLRLRYDAVVARVRQHFLPTCATCARALQTVSAVRWKLRWHNPPAASGWNKKLEALPFFRYTFPSWYNTHWMCFFMTWSFVFQSNGEECDLFLSLTVWTHVAVYDGKPGAIVRRWAFILPERYSTTLSRAGMHRRHRHLPISVDVPYRYYRHEVMMKRSGERSPFQHSTRDRSECTGLSPAGSADRKKTTARAQSTAHRPCPVAFAAGRNAHKCPPYRNRLLVTNHE